MPYIRGKTLGGSTTLNYMMYQRGNPRDYDLWVEMTGDKTWSYDHVLHYFKKSENYRGNYINASNSGGYIILISISQLHLSMVFNWLIQESTMGLAESWMWVSKVSSPCTKLGWKQGKNLVSATVTQIEGKHKVRSRTLLFFHPKVWNPSLWL